MEEEKGDDDYFDEEVAPLLPSPQRHRWLLTFEKLDEALEWCENSLLAVYFEKIKRIARMRSSEYTANDPMMISDLTTAVDIPSRSDSASGEKLELLELVI